jgi:chaperonin GroEL
MKILAFGKEARDKLKEGCEIMYRAVGTTYSPAGRNVAYARQWGAPKVVHDGVSVAKEVEVEDELVQLGVDLIKNAAENQVTATGDGTTLTTILSYHIVEKGMKLIEENPDVNAMKLRKQILKVIPDVIKEIQSFSQEVKTTEQIRHVAMVAADDEEIANAVTEAVEKVGANGLVTVELNKKQKIETEYTEGMEIERGFGNHTIFVTNPERVESIIENASVLVLGRKVTLGAEIVPLIEVVVNTGSKNVVFIGEISGDALMFLAQNKFKGNISTVVIPPPGYGDSRKNNLDDIALLVGATVVSDEIGMNAEQFRQSFNKNWIGTTKKVISTKFTTNIIPYTPDDFKDEAAKKSIAERQKLVKERVTLLQKQKEDTDSTYDKEQLSERLARLTTGIAVVKVGSRSEIETNEKFERVKDAVPAVQAAKEEGIVPGGAISLLRASKVLQKPKENTNVMNDGERLLYEVLREPIRKILANAGEEAKRIDEIVSEIEKRGGNFGYNVLSEKVEDLVKAGVIDPTKVIREAIENSASVGTSILTTDASIAIKTEKVTTNMQMA